ncbi:hypothetical protein BB561_001826 [Smittium simulii]|uniref:Uncharacterized protein n=1 Tax=Smittium simulii TaxID=133385 RepID=A0A2T9YSW4_9FUNG|nr:hypothetical protein BB561_001826 [Smittium simulii]
MKSFNISAFFALFMVLLAYVAADNHILLWKNEVTDVQLLRRLQNTDFSTKLDKRAAPAAKLDAKSNTLANSIGNTFWNIVKLHLFLIFSEK